MKIRGFLYVLLAAAPIWIQYLDSGEPIVARRIAVVAIASIVAGATALRAYIDQHISRLPENTDTQTKF